MEWPPQLKKLKEDVSNRFTTPETSEPAEFVRAEKPDPLSVPHLVELAKGNDIAGMVVELDNFYEGWNQYATEHNVFFSKDLRAMWKARTEAIQRAGAGDAEGVEAALTEIAGPLASAIEYAAENHEALLHERATSSKAENREALASTIDAFESTETTGVNESPEHQAQLDENTPDAVERTEVAPQEVGHIAAPAEPDELLLTEVAPNGIEGALPTTETVIPAVAAAEISPLEKANRRIVSLEEDAMQHAQAAYLTEYKNYHKTFRAKSGDEPESVKELERAYNKTRSTYKDSLISGAQAKIHEKIKNGTMDMERGAQLLKRFNTMVTLNRVFKPAAEARNQARLEAQGENAWGTFKKGMSWVAQKSQQGQEWLEEKTGSKSAAKFARILGTTLIIGGGAAAAGSFATGGLLAALGWGAIRTGRSVANSVIGGIAGEAIANTYSSLWGEDRHERRLEQMSGAQRELNEQKWRAKMIDFENFDDFETYDTRRQMLLEQTDSSNLKKFEQEKMLIRVFTSLALGVGTSVFLSHLPSGIATVTEVTTHVHATEPEPTHTVATPAPVHTEIAPASSPEIPHPAPAAHVPESVSVAEPAEKPVVHHSPVHHVEKPVAVERPVSAPEPEAAAQPADTQNTSQETPATTEPSLDQSAADSTATQPDVQHDPMTPSDATAQPEAPSSETQPASNAQAAPGTEAQVAPTPESQAVPESQPITEPQAAPAVEAIAPGIPLPPEAAIQAPAVHELTATPEAAPAASALEPHTTSTAAVASEAPSSGSSVPESSATSAPTETITNPPGFSSRDIIMESQAPTHPFLNINKVAIDPSEPHVYALKGLENGGVLWGGTDEERSAFVTEYFSNPLNRQTLLYVPAIDPAGDPLHPNVIALQADDTGIVNGYGLPGGKKELLKFPGVDVFSDVIL